MTLTLGAQGEGAAPADPGAVRESGEGSRVRRIPRPPNMVDTPRSGALILEGRIERERCQREDAFGRILRDVRNARLATPWAPRV